MDLDDLALFVQVVEAGGMSAAARRTGRTQPTVNRAMQRRDRESGVVEVLPS